MAQPPLQISGPQALQITEQVLLQLQKFWTDKGYAQHRSTNLWHLGAAKHLVVEHFYRMKDHPDNPNWCLQPPDKMTETLYRHNELVKSCPDPPATLSTARGPYWPQDFSQKFAR